MNTGKKSLEWLKPLELDAKDSAKFHGSIKKSVSQENLKKQANIFNLAKKLREAR